jgi:probable phosphoglycerate mutase
MKRTFTLKKFALILFRHGNTFEADEMPVWVGARTDLPLTAEGERQAVAAAAYIEQSYAPVLEIVAGPLQRTRRFAEIIGRQTRVGIAIDERLREIDYGKWEGLDRVTIRQRFGSDVLQNWKRCGTWPEGMDWKPSHDELVASLTGFLQEQNRKLVAAMTDAPEGAYNIVVTSNGILRHIFTIVTQKPCDSNNKVKTGNACILAPDGEGWHIMAWNEKPEKAKLDVI